MNKLLAASIGVVATLAVGGSAQAQWTGPYVGANAGGAIGDVRAHTSTAFSPAGYFATTSPPAIFSTSQQRLSPSGFTGGLQGGYNFQFGSFVVGAEADFGVMSTKDSQTSGAFYPCCAPTAFTITHTVSTDWLATVRPRVGFVGFFGSNSMIYATGGVAATNVKLSALFTDTFATAHESASATKILLGYSVGAGGEWLIAGNWSIKGEYLFSNFGSIHANSNNLAIIPPFVGTHNNSFNHAADIRMHVVRAGVNFHF